MKEFPVVSTTIESKNIGQFQIIAGPERVTIIDKASKLKMVLAGRKNLEEFGAACNTVLDTITKMEGE